MRQTHIIEKAEEMGKADDRMAWLRAQREADFREGRIGPRVAKPVKLGPVKLGPVKLEPVKQEASLTKPAVKLAEEPSVKQGFDRAGYMREYMRKRRDEE
jgi:hypothetical protein